MTDESKACEEMQPVPGANNNFAAFGGEDVPPRVEPDQPWTQGDAETQFFAGLPYSCRRRLSRL